ncbi:OPT family oligopeptide transporter [Megasphaera sp. DISK 18]|uniref:OPT family oligopeptide transporter n=1 Tax=Megasphaera sp. DISK 18 TaxID=1776081 RepID=UPI0008070F30|nr:oligopeptide transporter, OPT family [Megasphaera sp. DISK 18]OBZ32635.1 peptide transporter [Megasphaera sp. DISK 18]
MSSPNSDGRHYAPPMAPDRSYVEINAYVVGWGLFFAALFALAVGYLCLKIGQTVDAFAPVSVLAMGMAVLFKRKNAFPETVHIQAIASAGTNIIGGVMFILPALFILQLDSQLSFAEMVIPIVLGVLLATTFRRYFCEEMDAAYPFPSGRAAAEVLSCNEGSKAKVMVFSGLLAMAYDFVLNSLGWWQEVLSTLTFSWGQAAADKYKLAFSLDNDAALLGIGYFTGLRYAAIIAAGSFFSWFVCIPVVYYLGGDHVMTIGGQTVLLANASIDDVFSQYVRHIGIGMLAMAGIIGLVSMSGVVGRVMKRAALDMFSSKGASATDLLRTQQDMPMSQIVTGTLAMDALFILFFHVTCSQNITQTLLAGAIIIIFSFMLSVVGISSIAFTGNEPVSGMTIFMIIVSAVLMGNAGMSGSSGIIAILMMAAFLCATLAVAGNFMSELKVAYLTGATPKKMQQWQIVSIIVTSFVSVGVIFLLNHAYGYTGPGALAAPQANAMAAIVKPMMDGGAAPWPLYMAGAFFAFILWMMKVPPLAFALGAYLPMEINTPVLIGGLVSYFVSHSSKDEALNELRLSEGSTIASGFVAGGAIGSLISAVLHIGGVDWFLKDWVTTPGATYLGILAYLGLCAVIYCVACRIKKQA